MMGLSEDLKTAERCLRVAAGDLDASVGFADYNAALAGIRAARELIEAADEVVRKTAGRVSRAVAAASLGFPSAVVEDLVDTLRGVPGGVGVLDDRDAEDSDEDDDFGACGGLGTVSDGR